MAERVGLDIIQLHGAEGWEVRSTTVSHHSLHSLTLSDLLSLSLLAACPQIATQLNRPSIRVVHMEAGVTADNVRSQLKGGLASAVLLDSKGGGTGKTFDWEVGGEVQQKVPFILAEGSRRRTCLMRCGWSSRGVWIRRRGSRRMG